MGHAPPPRPKPDKLESVGGSLSDLVLTALLFVRIATWAEAVIGAVTGGMTLLIGAVLVFGAAQGAAMLLTPRLVARRDSVAGWVDEDRELVEDIVRRFLADEVDQAEFERLVEERLAPPTVEVKRYKEPPPNRRTTQGQDARIVGVFGVPSHVMSRNSHGEPSAANPDCPLFPPAFETEGLAE